MIVTFFTFTIFKWIIFKGMPTALAYWIRLHFKQTIGDIDLISGAVNTAIYTRALDAIFLNHFSWCFFILPLLSIQTGSFSTAQRTNLSLEQVHFVVGSINHSSPGLRIRCSLSWQTLNTVVGSKGGNMEHWISNSAVHEHWLLGVGFQTSPRL